MQIHGKNPCFTTDFMSTGSQRPQTQGVQVKLRFCEKVCHTWAP